MDLTAALGDDYDDLSTEDARERLLRAPHDDDANPAKMTLRQLVRVGQIISVSLGGRDMTGALGDVERFIFAVASESGPGAGTLAVSAAELWADVDRWPLVGDHHGATDRVEHRRP